MDCVSPAGPVYQAGTLSGNPLAMVAGIWSLKRLKPTLYKTLAALGHRLAAGLADAARDAGVAVQVNALGSMVTPFFTSARVRDFRSALSADTAAFGLFFREMLRRGVYLPPSQFEAWFISAAHRPRDVDDTIDAARAALRSVAKDRRGRDAATGA
jgi:glutamate-1-semialdehyde 2,1-aminomutase